MTMVLDARSPKEGAVGEQQHKAYPTRNEDCTPSRPEADASGQAQRGDVVHEGDHRHHRHFPWRRNNDTPICYSGRAALRRGNVKKRLKAGTVVTIVRKRPPICFRINESICNNRGTAGSGSQKYFLKERK
jgi:hypothetical protein